MRAIAAGLVLLLSAGCFPNLAGDTHVETVKRLTSPSGKTDAVLEFVSGGATVGSGYVVLVGPVGFDTARDSNRDKYITGSFSRGKDPAVDIAWTNNTQLTVRCAEFRDLYLNQPSLTIGKETISVDWIKN
ncbi:hypothetical protein [Nibricoccus aquaticus]|nr:hypothetical protein [Nibricoccus aquaticus]